jgi:hypothetical protein
VTSNSVQVGGIDDLQMAPVRLVDRNLAHAMADASLVWPRPSPPSLIGCHGAEQLFVISTTQSSPTTRARLRTIRTTADRHADFRLCGGRSPVAQSASDPTRTPLMQHLRYIVRGPHHLPRESVTTGFL